MCKHEIDFSSLPEGTDLWLFYQITDFGTAESGWERLVVTLTPGFDGRAFYEKDTQNNRLIVRSTQEGEVSARFVADRFDSSRWPNLRPDQDSDYKGHEISSKEF